METSPLSAQQSRSQLQQKNIFRSRVANACDICKVRKIKCSGTKPCGYCHKKGLTAEDCHYTAQQPRKAARRRNGVGGDGVGDSVGVGVGTASGGNGKRRREAEEVSSVSPGAVVFLQPHSHQHGQLPQEQRQPQHQYQHQHQHQHQERPQEQGRGKKRRRRLSFHTVNTTPREDNDDGGDENDDEDEPDDTEVPRDARLVRDPQGKLIFIGDCAPLSFFQTVRRLVTSRVDAAAFDSHGHGQGQTHASGLESGAAAAGGGNHHGVRSCSGGGSSSPMIDISAIPAAVEAYFQVTLGLVDLFEEEEEEEADEENDGDYDGQGRGSKLEEDIIAWARSVAAGTAAADATSAVNYLVLAIGHQALVDPPSLSSTAATNDPSQIYFEYARTLAFADLSGNFGIGSLQGVQVHVLIAVYMLLGQAHQTNTNGANGAFLFFGIAARAAYSLGIHRTEINARFGEKIQKQREKIWRSIRVVDLFLSTSMGRPPAASDVDCTVGYHCEERGKEGKKRSLNLLNASVQILLITERVVLQVYSRRKISVQLTEGISRELRDWSARWLGRLKTVVDGGENRKRSRGKNSVNGACQVLASYYYAVILVSRPFLMVELHHRLAAAASSGTGEDRDSLGYSGVAGTNGNRLVSGRTKLADACIDAAVLMVSPVQDLISRGQMARRAPVAVSWLFAASLVLGLGLLGGFGRVIEKHCRASIAALDYFAESDAHALQYSLIAKSLLATALEYLERRETMERSRRTESSAKIFGLLPREDIYRQGEAEYLPNNTTSHIADSGAGTGASTAENESVVIFTDPGTEMATKSHGRQQQHQPHGGLGHFEALLPASSRTNIHPSNNNFTFASSFFGLGGGGGEDALPRTPEFSSLMGVSMDEADDTFGALNLFPLLDSDGIDLSNLF